MRNLRLILLVCGNLLLGFRLVAQIRVTATVSPDAIGKNQYTEYRLVVENAGDIQKLQTPMFRHFNVIGSPSRESGMNSINGQVTRYEAFGFVLRPQQPGTFRIEPASVEINGKKYQSNAVNVQVSAATVSQPNLASRGYASPYASEPVPAVANDALLKEGEDPDQKARKNLLLRVVVNKHTAFVGEPIEATVELLSRMKCDTRILKSPSFNGFSVIDLPVENQGIPTLRKVDGKEYNGYALRHVQLYPLQAGAFSIGSGEAENTVQFVKEAYAQNMGGDINAWLEDMPAQLLDPNAVVTRRVNIQNESVNITVLPLPEAGKPVGFDGAVGEFKLTAQLARPSFAANENGELLLSVEGAGNLPMINAPAIAWPAGIDAFDPTVQDNADKTIIPVTGSRLFRYSFTAKEGSHTLPALTFSFFNPQKKAYQQVVTQPISFQVLPPDLTAIQRDTAAIREARPTFINRIFYHRWWIVVFVAGLIIAGLIFSILREKKKAQAEHDKAITDESEKEKPEAPTPYVDPLMQSSDKLYREQPAEFYSTLNRELKLFLATQLNRQPYDISPNLVADLLDQAGIGLSESQRWQQLMQEIEWKLYSPDQTPEQMQRFYAEAHALVKQLERSGIRPR